MSKKAVSGARKIAQVLEDHALLCLYILIFHVLPNYFTTARKTHEHYWVWPMNVLAHAVLSLQHQVLNHLCLIDQVSLITILTLSLQLLKEQVL